MLIVIIGILIILGRHQRDEAMDAVGLHLQRNLTRLNLLGGCEIHIGEIGLVFKGFPLEPLGVHIVGQLNLTAGNHGHLMTGSGQIEAHIPSGICAADDHHTMAQLVLMTEYRFCQPRGFGAGNRGINGLRTRGTENCAIALILEQRRCCFCAGVDCDLFLVQLPQQIGKIFPNGPLIVRHTGCHQLAAQYRGFFKQRYLMAAASCGERCH